MNVYKLLIVTIILRSYGIVIYGDLLRSLILKITKIIIKEVSLNFRQGKIDFEEKGQFASFNNHVLYIMGTRLLATIFFSRRKLRLLTKPYRTDR